MPARIAYDIYASSLVILTVAILSGGHPHFGLVRASRLDLGHP